jgi:hypothetical protein
MSSPTWYSLKHIGQLSESFEFDTSDVRHKSTMVLILASYDVIM